ncbi:LPS export ABC transporter periplasmic protein LptC [Bdellovibrionota bacterium FG-1]
MPPLKIFGKLIKPPSRRHLRPLFLWIVAGLVITKIVVLSPTSLEETGEKNTAVDPETLLEDDQQATLASGIPKNKIPEYSIDQFQYVSTQSGVKQWKLVAEKAFLYNKEKIVHSRQILAYLYDPDGKITVVRGRESKYFMNQRDLEIFGEVHTVFPDGFELKSEYLRYKPNDRKVEIPIQYAVHGDGHEKEGQNITFDSHGLDFAMAKSQIILPEAVHMIFEKLPDAPEVSASASPNPGPSKIPLPSPTPEEASDDSPTIIDSDHAIIHRDKHLAFFTMHPNRPLESRFVRITQPTLFTRGRRAVMHYGDYSQLLEYMIAYEDVFIKETPNKTKGKDTPPGKTPVNPPVNPKDAPPSLRYATGGKAEFDTQSDVIRLTEFPQAYQDNDTVTGDIILMHRHSDLIEVEHSNSFSEGNN